MQKSVYEVDGSKENLKLKSFLDLLEEIFTFVNKNYEDRSLYRKFIQIAFSASYFEQIASFNNRLNQAR